jgi:hypothetical protein
LLCDLALTRFLTAPGLIDVPMGLFYALFYAARWYIDLESGR